MTRTEPLFQAIDQPSEISFLRRCLRLTFVYYSDMLEIHLGTMMFLWGAWISIPWLNTFANPAYTAMAALAPEWVWGAWMAVLGGIQQLSTIYEDKPARRMAAFVAALQWLFMGLCVMHVSPPAVGCAILPFMALSNALCYVRLTIDRKVFGSAAS